MDTQIVLFVIVITRYLEILQVGYWFTTHYQSRRKIRLLPVSWKSVTAVYTTIFLRISASVRILFGSSRANVRRGSVEYWWVEYKEFYRCTILLRPGPTSVYVISRRTCHHRWSNQPLSYLIVAFTFIDNIG